MPTFPAEKPVCTLSLTPTDNRNPKVNERTTERTGRAVIESEGFGPAQAFRHNGKGPMTAARHRRTAIVYAVLSAVALMPLWLGASAGGQVAGLGLVAPGAGFFTLGGAWVLMVPAVLALFWLACIARFWIGMVIAPLGVWLAARRT